MLVKSRPPKTHGFSHGLNIYQVLSVIIITIKIVIFQYFFISKFMKSLALGVGIFYYVSIVMLVIFGLLATLCDPTDDVVKAERKAKAAGDGFDTARFEFHCEICETSVSHNSKHCRVCERCVDAFDHHCEWVNNCISKKNYKEFVSLIISLGVSVAIFLASGIFFFVSYFTDSIQVLENVEWVRSHTPKWKIGLVMFYMTLMTVLLMLDTRLIVFHYFLARNKMTTYEYIVMNREKQREKTSNRRSSLMIKKDKEPIKETPDLEAPVENNEQKDCSLSYNDQHVDKSASNKNYDVKLAFDKLKYEDSGNEGSNVTPKETKVDTSNLSSTDSVFSSAKTNNKPIDRREAPNQSYNDASSTQNHSAIELRAEKQSLSKENKSAAKLGKDVSELTVEIPEYSGSSHGISGGFPMVISPSDKTFSPRDTDSYQELTIQEHRESRDLDQSQKQRENTKDAFESRFLAVSIAKIINNYGPKYGKILEEENESERPAFSENGIN